MNKKRRLCVGVGAIRASPPGTDGRTDGRTDGEDETQTGMRRAVAERQCNGEAKKQTRIVGMS